MTLKKGQDHKIWYELVDPNQCHNNAKLQKTSREQRPEKANNKLFAKSENTSVLFS